MTATEPEKVPQTYLTFSVKRLSGIQLNEIQ